jgi:sulfate adenylyltransferase subunit 1
MVTAASSADAAVVLVDATKLDWKNADLELLPQTRRHSLLAHLLRVHSLVFAVNKLDAVADPALAFAHIRGALRICTGRGHPSRPPCPSRRSRATTWSTALTAGPATTAPACCNCWKNCPTPRRRLALAFPVQWVEKFSSSPTPARAAACSGAVWQAAPRSVPRCRFCPAASWRPWPRS